MSNDPATLSHLRHELRTPLNHVIGYSEMLLDDAGERWPALVSDLRHIHTAGQQVLGLIDEFLAPGRAEAPDLERLLRAATPALDAIASSEEVLRKSAGDTAGVRFVDDLARIRESADHLRQLLTDGVPPAGGATAVAPSDARAAVPVHSSEAPSTEPATILVVDDNAENRDVLARRLERDGHRVEIAGDGSEALAAVAATAFDLILLDVMMPVTDGVEVLRRLKSDEALRHIPVLMISALGEMDSVVRCIELGAEDYLPKPFDPILLRARIAACLEKKRLRDQERRLLAELAEWNRSLERRVAEKVAEIERLGQLTRFVAPQLAQAILAGGADDPLKPQRREIVVVFLDIGGFGTFMETAEPEEVMGVLREYHAEMGQLILVHEGTVERFAGDGIIIIFNAPLETSNPAERAVRMALAMRDRFAELAARWRRRGWEMTLGIGIAQGFATIGAIGFEGRLDYGAMGRVMAFAAALCRAARKDQILVMTKIAAAVEPIVEAAAVEGLQLRGLARQFPVFNVVRLKEP